MLKISISFAPNPLILEKGTNIPLLLFKRRVGVEFNISVNSSLALL
ncbi:hypothetical protein KKC04_00690 [Patescibacteria group bacterium]|nr:hypothetical protein [Patescibacteria group bacterium]